MRNIYVILILMTLSMGKIQSSAPSDEDLMALRRSEPGVEGGYEPSSSGPPAEISDPAGPTQTTTGDRDTTPSGVPPSTTQSSLPSQSEQNQTETNQTETSQTETSQTDNEQSQTQQELSEQAQQQERNQAQTRARNETTKLYKGLTTRSQIIRTENNSQVIQIQTQPASPILIPPT